METELTSTTLSTWFDETEAIELDASRLVLYTPSDFKKDIITTRYIPHIQKALKELFSADMEVAVLGEGELEQRSGQDEDSFLPGTEA